jgi:hypothetical protein
MFNTIVGAGAGTKRCGSLRLRLRNTAYDSVYSALYKKNFHFRSYTEMSVELYNFFFNAIPVYRYCKLHRFFSMQLYTGSSFTDPVRNLDRDPGIRSYQDLISRIIRKGIRTPGPDPWLRN